MANEYPTRGPTRARPPRLLRDLAYDRVKYAIQSGGILPGHYLDVGTLQQDLQISRKPIHEALAQLAREGAVQMIPDGGARVATMSFEHVLDVLHLRTLIEPELARLVATGRSSADCDLLRARVEEMAAAAVSGDRDAWRQADDGFHAALANACPSALLAQYSLDLRTRLRSIMASPATPPPSFVTCTEEHRTIFDAIVRSDGDAAASATRSHLTCIRDRLFSRIAR